MLVEYAAGTLSFRTALLVLLRHSNGSTNLYRTGIMYVLKPKEVTVHANLLQNLSTKKMRVLDANTVQSGGASCLAKLNAANEVLFPTSY